MNMANRHPLNHSSRREAALQTADLILALEPIDLWGLNNYVPDLVTRPNDARRRQAGLKIIHIGTEMMMAKSNYQDFQRFAEADLSISGDAEATMPTLIEALKAQMAVADKNRFAARGKKVKELSAKLLDQLRHQAAYGWDAKPISAEGDGMAWWH